MTLTSEEQELQNAIILTVRDGAALGTEARAILQLLDRIGSERAARQAAEAECDELRAALRDANAVIGRLAEALESCLDAMRSFPPPTIGIGEAAVQAYEALDGYRALGGQEGS